MFSTLAFTQKESTVTKRKSQGPSPPSSQPVGGYGRAERAGARQQQALAVPGKAAPRDA